METPPIRTAQKTGNGGNYMRFTLSRLKIAEVYIEEYLYIDKKHLYWLNVDFYHPKMMYEDGCPYVKGLYTEVLKFKENKHVARKT